MAQRRDSGPDPSAVWTRLIVSASSEPDDEPDAWPHRTGCVAKAPTRSSAIGDESLSATRARAFLMGQFPKVGRVDKKRPKPVAHMTPACM
eukprot:scaffold26824_cov67-Phaeocystis_antarctica.AAC.3